MAWVVYASKLLQKLIHKNPKEQTRTQGVYGNLQSCVRFKRRSHWQDYKNTIWNQCNSTQIVRRLNLDEKELENNDGMNILPDTLE